MNTRKIELISAAFLILCLLLSALATPATGATLILVAKGNGGSIITEDGNLTAKKGMSSRSYSGKVVIHAAPWDGWTLKQWSGDCSGRANICVVRMNRNRKAIATWERDPNEVLRAYTSAGDDLGRIMNVEATRYATVLTDKGYTVTIDVTDGNIRIGPVYYVGYTGLNCNESAWVREPGPGVVAIDNESGITTWVPLGAQRQITTIWSSYVDGVCETLDVQRIWGDGYPAKQAPGSNVTLTGLPETLPFDPIEVR